MAPRLSPATLSTAGRETRGAGRTRLALPWFQLRRALREPRRLGRLHYSSLLTALHATIEPRDDVVLAALFGADPPALRTLERELLDDRAFLDEIEDRHRRLRGTPLRLFGCRAAEDHDRPYRLLYLLARLARPRLVVETGVFDGLSSAVLLKALRDAGGGGRLRSIDVPARHPVASSTATMAQDRLPAGGAPGWIVPDALRGRWELRLGTSRDLLDPWLAELGTIDLFFHDSLHTAANMTHEFATAWPALAPGGLLVADDVWWNSAFHRFCRRVGRRPHVLRGVGMVRTPDAREGTA